MCARGSSSCKVADLLDRVYDTLTQGAAVVGTALGVDMSDVALPRSSPGTSSDTSGAPFRIEEVIDGATGKMVFVVTDGSGTSCDAPTRELAEATRDALDGVIIAGLVVAHPAHEAVVSSSGIKMLCPTIALTERGKNVVEAHSKRKIAMGSMEVVDGKDVLS